MALTIRNATFDCHDPSLLAEFWAEALDYDAEDHGDYAFAYPERWKPREDSPRLLFQRVPEPTPGKRRVHFDLTADDMEAEVKRLVELGARELQLVEEAGLTWTVMADPEDNEFCVLQAPDG